MPYVTPNTAVVGTICRRLIIPDHPLIVAAVNGAITELLFPWNWRQELGLSSMTPSDVVALLQPHIYAFFDDACTGDCTDAGNCTNYPPSAGFISYAPANPYNDPQAVPSGYPAPPFYIAGGGVLSPYQQGDVLTELNRFPIYQNIVDVVTVGLPRFRVHVTSTEQNAEVELHLLAVPQGGYALVTRDDDPGTIQYVDTNSISIIDIGDLGTLFNLILEGDLVTERIVEVTLPNPGNHYVDVTFFPNVGTEVIVGFGGGLRRLELCGAVPIGDIQVPQFQIVDCDLQWRPTPNDAWIVIGNVCGADGVNGTDGRTPIMGNDGGVIWWAYQDDPINSRVDLIDLSGVGTGSNAVDLRCRIAWGMARYLLQFHYIPAINSIYSTKDNGGLLGDAYAPAFQSFNLSETMGATFESAVDNAWAESLNTLNDIVLYWETSDLMGKLALAFWTFLNDCALFPESAWDDILAGFQGSIDVSPLEELAYDFLLASDWLHVRSHLADYTAWALECDCGNFQGIPVIFCRDFNFDLDDSQLAWIPENPGTGDRAVWQFSQWYYVSEYTSPKRAYVVSIELTIDRPITITSFDILIYLARADQEAGYPFVCAASVAGDAVGSTPIYVELGSGLDGYQDLIATGSTSADTKISVTVEYYSEGNPPSFTNALLTLLRVRLNGEGIAPLPFVTGSVC